MHLCSTCQDGRQRFDSCGLVDLREVVLHSLVHHFESAVKLLSVAPPSVVHVTAVSKQTRKEEKKDKNTRPIPIQVRRTSAKPR